MLALNNILTTASSNAFAHVQRYNQNKMKVAEYITTIISSLIPVRTFEPLKAIHRQSVLLSK